MQHPGGHAVLLARCARAAAVGGGTGLGGGRARVHRAAGRGRRTRRRRRLRRQPARRHRLVPRAPPSLVDRPAAHGG